MLVLAVQESQRVDRQLKGRAGRQGDPGETYTLVRVDDPITESAGMGAGLALVKPFFEGDLLSLSLPLSLPLSPAILSGSHVPRTQITKDWWVLLQCLSQERIVASLAGGGSRRC